MAVHIKNFIRSDCAGGIHGFADDLMQGDADFAAIKTALSKYAPNVPLTAEMIPFCRLPDLVLPDMKLAQDTAAKMKKIFCF